MALILKTACEEFRQEHTQTKHFILRAIASIGTMLVRPIGRGLRALAVRCLNMEPSERPDLEQIEKLLDVIEQLCRPLVQADVQVVGVVCLPSFRSVFP